jgi:hypothetical protein
MSAMRLNENYLPLNFTKIITMKKSIILLALSFLGYACNAQIARTNIVEHFTNSNCGVCAGTNPTIYNALNANPNVLHITFHPSSPYASCVFSQSNPLENDGRTNFYNIYGGTPRVITNGVLGGASALATNLSNAASGTTNFDLKTTQTFVAADSVNVLITIKKIAADTNTVAILFAGAKQDTVFQTTGNGESIHRDVFRKALTPISGVAITLPTNINDSVNFAYSYKLKSNWDSARMQTITILQRTNKSVINASQSTNKAAVVITPTSIKPILSLENNIYPNPTSDVVDIENWKRFNSIEIINGFGQVAYKGKLITNKVSVSALAEGFYTVVLKGTNTTVINKLQIKK